MKKPSHIVDISLQPGEFYFGDKTTRIRTLLGSCIAITLWHPLLRVGGMCHYLLPNCNSRSSGIALDGRYADHAMSLFMLELDKISCRPADCKVKMFGGGNQFMTYNGKNVSNLPEKNIQAGRQLLKHYGFAISSKHLGGYGYRNVIFDVWSGHAWVRHTTNKMGEQLKQSNGYA